MNEKGGMNVIQFERENITVFQSVLYQTTTAVIQTEEAIIMTDPTWLPEEIRTLQNYIHDIQRNRPLYIIYTHSDFDHIIGAGAFPNATVIATEQFAKNPKKEAIVEEIQAFDQSYYLTRNYSVEYPAVDIVVSKDEQKVVLGSTELIFYLAPGHTDDSLFTMIEPNGIFLAGDYLSDVEFPFITSSYHDYAATIGKAESLLRKWNPTILVPGHGSATQNQTEIKSRLSAAKYYLEHLLNEQVQVENWLKQQYSFFEGMRQQHKENQALAKRE